jgi:hypothetical protein
MINYNGDDIRQEGSVMNGMKLQHDRPELTPEDEKLQMQAAQRNNKRSE